MTLGSKILGFTLITFGLMLLIFVLTGFIGESWRRAADRFAGAGPAVIDRLQELR